MAYLTYKSKFLSSVSCIDPLYMEKIKIHYKRDIIFPKYCYHDFMCILSENFSLTKIDYNDLDIMSSMSLNSSIFSANDAKLWVVSQNIQSEIFYKYFNKRFLEKTLICLIYIQSEDLFVSNCSLLSLFLSVSRGIELTEIKQNTPDYCNYLSNVHFYNQGLDEVENY